MRNPQDRKSERLRHMCENTESGTNGSSKQSPIEGAPG
jgi:hypothetical protein